MHKNYNRNLFILLLLSLLFIILIHPATGQNFKFKRYGIQHGICHPFVYTVNQDKNGFIWIGTGEGLCSFDGFEFSSMTNNDSIPRDVVISSFKDSKDNLWFGFQNGTLVVYNGRKFTLIKPLQEVKSSITCITENSEGDVIASSMGDGILVIKNNVEVIRYGNEFKNKLISSIAVFENQLLVGSQEGLEIYDIENVNSEPGENFKVEELAFVNIRAIKKTKSKTGFWIATEDNGVFYFEPAGKKYNLVNISENFSGDFINVQSLFEDPESNLWLSTLRDGIYKLERRSDNKFSGVTKINKSNGLPGNYIKEIFEDREGNFWVATYGDGLALFLNNAFSFFSFNDEIFNNVLSVCSHDSILWIGGKTGLIKNIRSSGKNVFIKNGLPQDEISALFFDSHKTLWIGTGKNGIYKLDVSTNIVSKFNYQAASLGLSINAISGNKTILYVATKDGIYYFDLNNNKSIHYTTYNGLPHNNIEHVFIDNENNLLFASRSNGIYEIDISGEVRQRYLAGNFEVDFNSITQDLNGDIWASTYGSGVFHFTSDSIVVLTAANGLKSDFCYGIVSSVDGSVWVGHRMGISKINLNNYYTEIFDVEKGISGDINPNAVFKDSKGNLFFGTTEGLISYNPEKDSKKKIEPKTNIVRVLINEKPIDLDEEIVLPYSKYKVRIDFIGLYFSEPEQVYYQYKLEGFDPDWSDITTVNYANYPRVQDGKYTFSIRSFTKDGLSSESTVSFSFRIKLPFYKTWWFISLSAAILVLVVLLIIKIREKKQKQLQVYLEKRLEERTREVVEQKEEIEIKNRDITDSINYAQRIQASILPPLKRLQLNFDGAFVFYQPRDIVSGDFYWFDRISESKFIIVCADSTGHGVPGAFMSMIGTTLLKDICSRDELRSPSEILRNLDQELRSTLNQNMEAEKANDGMDIIVCEIDLKTYYVRYASAMRPMIIYKDNEEYYVKGSRSSVGGHYDKSDKDFQDEGIQLSKGDLIYMFSDGYPDQFGGPMGKKFKMVRLKNLLEDICKKPMEEQYNHVKNTFNLWKEDYPQVDDVLFMGIKL